MDMNVKSEKGKFLLKKLGGQLGEVKVECVGEYCTAMGDNGKLVELKKLIEEHDPAAEHVECMLKGENYQEDENINVAASTPVEEDEDIEGEVEPIDIETDVETDIEPSSDIEPEIEPSIEVDPDGDELGVEPTSDVETDIEPSNDIETPQAEPTGDEPVGGAKITAVGIGADIVEPGSMGNFEKGSEKGNEGEPMPGSSLNLDMPEGGIPDAIMESFKKLKGDGSINI